MTIVDTIKEETAEFMEANPFVNASGFDLRLAGPTQPGKALAEPFVNTDHWGRPRTRWDRGAFEWVE